MRVSTCAHYICEYLLCVREFVRVISCLRSYVCSRPFEVHLARVCACSCGCDMLAFTFVIIIKIDHTTRLSHKR